MAVQSVFTDTSVDVKTRLIDGSIGLENGLALEEISWLSSATFQRLGPDLVLEGPGGQEILIVGYFSAGPTDLVGPSGLIIPGHIVARLSGPQAPQQWAQATNPNLGEPIGTVETQSGDVFVIRVDGTREPLAEGDPVFQGDTLETGADGVIGVTFVDDSSFSLDQNGRMVLDEMVYDPGSQDGSATMFLVQGAMTFVSGAIAKTNPDAMIIQTPLATVGIRGTTGGVKAAPDGKTSVVLMSEQDADNELITGEIVVQTAGGSITFNNPFQGTTISDANSPPPAAQTMSLNEVGRVFGNALTSMPRQDALPASFKEAVEKVIVKERAREQAEQAEATVKEAEAEAQKAEAEAQALKEQAEEAAEQAEEVAEQAELSAEEAAALEAQAAEAEAAALAAAAEAKALAEEAVAAENPEEAAALKAAAEEALAEAETLAAQAQQIEQQATNLSEQAQNLDQQAAQLNEQVQTLQSEVQLKEVAVQEAQSTLETATVALNTAQESFKSAEAEANVAVESFANEVGDQNLTKETDIAGPTVAAAKQASENEAQQEASASDNKSDQEGQTGDSSEGGETTQGAPEGESETPVSEFADATDPLAENTDVTLNSSTEEAEAVLTDATLTPETTTVPQTSTTPSQNQNDAQEREEEVVSDNTPSSPSSSTFSGKAIDGYISGARVFVDVDEDGVWDDNEDYAYTDSNGDFTLTTSQSGSLRVTGGTDIETGLSFNGTMSAPMSSGGGSFTITPLTSLIFEQMNQGQTEAEAQNYVKQALGLSNSSVDLLNFDPFAQSESSNATTADLAKEIMRAGILIANTLSQAVAAFTAAGGDSANATQAVFKAIADKIVQSNGETVDLSVSTTVSEILNEAQSQYRSLNGSAAEFDGNDLDNAISVIAASNAQTNSIETAQNASDLREFLKKNAVVSQRDARDAIESAVQNNSDNAISDFNSVAKFQSRQNGQGTNGNDTISGDSFNNKIEGLAGNDTLTGQGGNDLLYGGTGNDDLEGGIGDDQLFGGAGNDNLFASQGNDSITGGAGIDTLIFENLSAGVTLQLGTGSGTATDDINNVYVQDAIENIRGTNYLDNISSTKGDNTVWGLLGDDTIFADEGDDVIFGGAGDDKLSGFLGDDTLYGGDGNDFLLSGSGNDVVYGGAGDDDIGFYAGQNTLDGGTGTDRLNMSTLLQGSGVTVDLSNNGAGTATDGTNTWKILGGFENIFGSNYSDNITADDGDNTIFGGSGIDAGDDILNGGGGNDDIRGLNGDDTLDGGQGNDTLYGFNDNDVLLLSEGTDDLWGGNGTDTVSAANMTADTDINLSAAGASSGMHSATVNQMENIIGSDYNDTLTGDSNDNVINGGAGDDLIISTTGSDTYQTGTGDDIVRFADASHFGALIGEFEGSFGDDKIQVSYSDVGLTTGDIGLLLSLSSVTFETGTIAADQTNVTSGFGVSGSGSGVIFSFLQGDANNRSELYVDTDGIMSGGAVKLAEFESYTTTITGNDIEVIVPA